MLFYRSPPYRELQNQAESEFLRRLDEITFENAPSPVSNFINILKNNTRRKYV